MAQTKRFIPQKIREITPADLPDTARREYALWGQQPPRGNIGSEGQHVDSLTPYAALETARALQFALDETESNGIINSPAGGHDHSEPGALDWVQVGSWTPHTAAPANLPGRRRVDETSDTAIAFFPVFFAPDVRHIYIRASVEISGGVTSLGLRLRWRFFAPASLNGSADLDAGYLARQVTAPENFIGWLKGGPFDVSSIPLTSRKRIAWCLVEAAVTSDHADVFELQIAPLRDPYRAPPTRVDLDASLAEGDRQLPDSTLKTLFLDNVARLRTLTFGDTYPLPRDSRAHDHGQNRGKTLDRPLLSVLYGPHVPEGSGATAGGDLGLPLPEPDTGAGVSFTSDPKLIAQHPLLVLGGVDEIVVRALVYIPGAADRAALTVEVRPFSDGGYGPGGHLGVTGSLTFEPQAHGEEFLEATATLDLSSLGDVARDRLFEVCLWLTSNPVAPSSIRLCGLLAYPGDPPAQLPESPRFQPRESLAVAKIRKGQETTTLLADKASATLNQVCFEILGGVPGYKKDRRTPDTTDPWRRLLSKQHGHQGEYTDEAGNRVNDGACLRYPLFVRHYGLNIRGGSTESTTSSDAKPTLGQLIHPNSSINVLTWARFMARASIPQGLGAFDLYGLIQPGTSLQICRLYCFVQVLKLNGNQVTADSIVTRVSSGPFFSTNPLSLFACQVLPEEGAIWQPSSLRIAHGLGVWTLDALRAGGDLPDGVSTDNPARLTQPIRVEISPDATADYIVNVRWGLQTGVQTAIVQGGTYAPEARLLAMCAIPSEGF